MGAWEGPPRRREIPPYTPTTEGRENGQALSVCLWCRK